MDDLADREAFFRAGGGGGGYAGPGPGNGGGPPPNRPPVNHPYGDERTPHGGAAGGNWGPSPDNAVTTREHLARQRQAEYNEHLLRQQHAKEQAHAARHGHQGGRQGQGQGQGGRPGQHNQQSQQNAGVSPGLQFDEEQQQRPRAKGFHGLRDIHNSGEKLRVKAEAAKKQYAAELQQQIEFKKRAKLVDKQHSLELDRHSLGMGNIITDMHDGTLDGVDENGSYMGYDYRDAHQVRPPWLSHIQPLFTDPEGLRTVHYIHRKCTVLPKLVTVCPSIAIYSTPIPRTSPNSRLTLFFPIPSRMSRGRTTRRKKRRTKDNHNTDNKDNKDTNTAVGTTPPGTARKD